MGFGKRFAALMEENLWQREKAAPVISQEHVVFCRSLFALANQFFGSTDTPQAPAPEDISADAIFNEPALFEDLWHDAEVCKVLRYLRGGVGLQLPAEWREHIPSGPVRSPKETKRTL